LPKPEPDDGSNVMPSTVAQTATTGPKRMTTMALLVALAAAIISAVWGPCDEHNDDEHNDEDHDDNDVDDDNDDDDNEDDKANTATAVGGDNNGGNSDGQGHRQQSTKIGSEDTVAVATAIR
jgi:hypothetical protein